MTDTTTSQGTSVPMSLPARAIGVLFSPRATYASIAAHPRVVGAFVAVLALTAGITMAFLFTSVGQEANIDLQYQMFERMERSGIRMPPEAYDRIDSGAAMAPYWSAGGQITVGLIAATALAGILLVVFNFGLGGEASYKQVLSVVVHSWFVMVIAVLFATPLNYAQGSMVGRSNLAVFLPFLDDSSFLARLFGLVDLFWIWWIVNLAIGIGVLYKKKTGPIAWGLLGAYAVCILLIAAVMSRFSGA